MKTRIIMTAAVLALVTAMSAGDLLAAGRGNGNGYGGGRGNGQVVCTQQQTAAKTGTAVRPEGSRRRDGTFLTTGVTANGAATRPGRGNGLQDGSRLVPATAPETPVTP